MTQPNPPYPPNPWPPQGGPPQGMPPQGMPPQGVQPLPYQSAPPQPPYGYGYLGYGAVRCPRCGDPRSSPVLFTWWGGLVGPRILSHVRCATCGNKYNGKTGQSNTTGIIIYSVVGGAIGLAVLAVLFFFVAGTP